MKRSGIYILVTILVPLLGLTGCTSSSLMQEAVAQTQTVVSYSTQVFELTSTPYPTVTPTPAETSKYRLITWAQLVDFILEDHINWNGYSDEYNCVDFSLDLVTNASHQNIEAWVVGVTFADDDKGHAFVAFPTIDRGIIWIEPQSDDAYAMSQVGRFLCLANDPNMCWSAGKIVTIIQPARCDRVTHKCW